MTVQPHYFIAVTIDDKVKQKLASWCENEHLPFQRFVHKQDLHITLAFLGGVESLILEELKEALQVMAKQHVPFTLTIDNLGYFGKNQAPRIFWASVKQENKLYELQKDVHQTCVDLGIKLEDRAYSPHITLARKYIAEEPYADDALKEKFHSYLKSESWRVASFVIYQTHLKKTPKYEVVASFKLSEL
ncbi:RNA 2',3'-cyclic phosphodiesterase [Anaerobacillus isosaccharinicus]|uniref:RNA 2',3'-cyclic phosphodiesterase n=1 Tax=Anaerobacillus isosaccharinicus TaxID=1532552 RepID=A0A1S2KTL1_9BACI|nr:RNA 2',3'-cyclic phosphodiesterase [Anaerobacillus isosaccharinicus]MBA5588049.1 RNA 2',3'-cyclic phosphodiesterase [Anaerobacillus isosaccharinicus]QOY33811.1 RNA 2',3'-cyclic phosphodiesterase [Anaerobacillus isosaccharinicus]